jgi:hypothetical protein
VAVTFVGEPVVAEMAARIVSPTAIEVAVKSLVELVISSVPVLSAIPLVLIEFEDVGTAVPDATFQNLIVTVPLSAAIAAELLPEPPMVQATGLVRYASGSLVVVSTAPPS